ncbi:MAG: hypothetical protein ACK4SX_15660, partial [Alcanivoracaceae bacterium]
PAAPAAPHVDARMATHDSLLVRWGPPAQAAGVAVHASTRYELQHRRQGDVVWLHVAAPVAARGRPHAAVQSVRVRVDVGHDLTSGTFRLAFGDAASDPLRHDASEKEVLAAVRALGRGAVPVAARRVGPDAQVRHVRVVPRGAAWRREMPCATADRCCRARMRG